MTHFVPVRWRSTPHNIEAILGGYCVGIVKRVDDGDDEDPTFYETMTDPDDKQGRGYHKSPYQARVALLLRIIRYFAKFGFLVSDRVHDVAFTLPRKESDDTSQPRLDRAGPTYLQTGR